MEQQRAALRSFMDDLTVHDQRMTFCVLTIVHTADTLQELNNDTEALKSAVCTCQLATLKFQQMQDLRELLLTQSEPEAKELGLELELYTKGSFNTFSQQTNVDTENALICYDILDLDSNLMSVGMLVVLDSILNRITRNRAQKCSTFIVIDEIYLMFQNQFSADFLFKLWKRVRKYGAFCTGITQNVGDLLESHTAQTMLSNSEFVIMLNQAAPDRKTLAELMHISDEQLNYITNVGVGRGLMKIGSSLIPFENDFPKDLAPNMYQLMTTKLDEV